VPVGSSHTTHNWVFPLLLNKEPRSATHLSASRDASLLPVSSFPAGGWGLLGLRPRGICSSSFGGQGLGGSFL
jgi:hypothetical protein